MATFHFENQTLTLNSSSSNYILKPFKLRNVGFNLDVYNINAELLTNTFIVETDAPLAPTVVTLTQGIYTRPEDLRAEIQTQLVALDANFVVAFSDITRLFTISNAVNNFRVDFRNTNTNLILGFLNNYVAMVATITAPEKINLIPFKAIYFNIAGITSSKRIDVNNVASYDGYIQLYNSTYGDNSIYKSRDDDDVINTFKINTMSRILTIAFYVFLGNAPHQITLNQPIDFIFF
ncbi:MAG: hypothetical protein UR43_C0020G0010 [candidate division TM6 bacterium GW2011_GWF2_33_332]|nr:MAG: hypothetical protein UR43_C0020G0010 [candidate division TM6 bacterium GW2011_GWF2_33_332]